MAAAAKGPACHPHRCDTPDELAQACALIEDGKVAIINMSMCQEDIDTVARLPYSGVISDAIYADGDTLRPRMFGAFPKILREYVRERGIYTMQEAIRRMTAQPAARMKLAGRGRLERGCYADVNIFDPAQFRDNATFAQSTQPATGLDYCIINGKIAVQNGCVVRKYCGHSIRVK